VTLSLGIQDVFVNIVGYIKVKETSVDLVVVYMIAFGKY
jgi:predicted ATP-dependent serine protease